MTYLQTFWWLPLAGAAVAVWVAVAWPRLATEHVVSGRLLGAVSVLAIAVVTPLTFLFGPHLDPLRLARPADVGLPAWLAWTRLLSSLLLLACLVVVVTARTGRRNAGAWLVIAFAAFAGVELASGAVNGGLRPALTTALALAPITVLWASGQSWAETVAVLRWALRLLVWPSLLLAVADPGWAYWPEGLGRTLFGVPQLVGATEHPNALGPAAAMLLILEYAKPRRRHWQARCAVAVTVLVLTQSRTAWTAILVAGLFVAVLGRRGAARWLAGTAAAALLWWLWAAPSALDFTGRPAVWAYAYQQFRAHPLLGSGPGFLESAYNAGRLPPELGWIPRHAHNQVLQSAATAGVLGLVVLFLLTGVLVAAAVRAAAATGGASVALLGVVVTRCVTEVPLSTGVTGFLLNLVLFAVLFAGLRERMRSADVGRGLVALPLGGRGRPSLHTG